MNLTRRHTVAPALLMVAGLALTGCSGEEAKNAASNASTAAGNAASNASTAAGDAASKASTAAGDAASKASTAASGAASKASSKASTAAGAAAGQKAYTMAQVKSHNTPENCWAVVDKGVYNLTTWITKHPGGADKIKPLCGTDATSKFRSQHNTEKDPNARLASFKIGTLQG